MASSTSLLFSDVSFTLKLILFQNQPNTWSKFGLRVWHCAAWSGPPYISWSGDRRVCSNGAVMISWGRLKNLEETYSSASLPTMNPTWNHPELKLGLFIEKPTSRCLNYSMASFTLTCSPTSEDCSRLVSNGTIKKIVRSIFLFPSCCCMFPHGCRLICHILKLQQQNKYCKHIYGRYSRVVAGIKE
jgi:hypothetical protein